MTETSPSLETMGYKQELKRTLKLSDLVAYGVIFISPLAPIPMFGFIFNASHGMVPLTYVVGVVAMLFTAWSYVTMARTFPAAGSVYTYAARTMGEYAGNVAGWAILLAYLLLPVFLYALGAAALAAVVPEVPRWVWFAILVVGIGTINLMGVESTTKASIIILVLDIIFLAVFMVILGLGTAHGVNGAHFSLQPLFNAQEFSVTTIFAGLSLAAVSFLGFDAVSTLAEEAEGGGAAVGKATVISLLLIAALFVAQTYMLCLLLPGQISLAPDMNPDQATYDIAGIAGGTWFKIAVSLIGGAGSAIPAALTCQAAVSRLLFGMARDGKLPPFLAHVSKKQVPDRAILAVTALTVVLLALIGDQIDTMASLINFGALVGFMFVNLAVIAHFTVKLKDGKWGPHLLAPLIGFTIVGYIVWNMDRTVQYVGVAWLAIGVLGTVAMRALRKT